METNNRKIIEAIIEKAERDCPGSLAMIGIYGSFCTGDIHAKSDLDLMILINDDKGYCLSHTFLLEDVFIAHDLYCTTWEALENDAKFQHPHLAKLMDSKIVYCADDAYMARLEALRAKVPVIDTAEAARKMLANAEQAFAKAMVAKDIATVRYHAVDMILNCLDSIVLWNKRYFHFGTRRVFDEIGAMERKPENLRALVETIAKEDSVSGIKASLIPLLQAVEALFTESPSAPEVYPGTCEEMLSNWRNKMYLAAETKDIWLSLSSMASLDAMLKDLGFHWHVLSRFNPHDLAASANAYDAFIEDYRKEYEKAGIPFQSYSNVDAFLAHYIKKQA